MATQAQITAVQQLYVSYLGRAADSAGLAFWSNAISTGTATVASVATGLTLATEYKTAYAGLTNDALVDKVYTNVLGRPADAAGKAFWVASFANGSVKADTFVSSLISSLGTQDQQTINNKTFVAQTYTDTAGTSYNASAATSVLVGVNSSVASVNTAIANISNGTLTGLVPGAALINAVATANAAVTTFAKTTASTNPTFDTTKDGSVDTTEATAALNTATGVRAVVSTDSTTLLNAKQTDAIAATATAKTALLAVATAAQKLSITAYDNAVTAQAALVQTDAQKAAAAVTLATNQKGVDVAVTASGATVTYLSLDGKVAGAHTAITSAATLYTALTSTTLSAEDRIALTTELAKVPTYGAALTTSANQDLAIAKADALVTSTKALVSAIDSDGATLPGPPITGAKQEGLDYTNKVDAQKIAVDLVVKAVAADVAVTAAKTVTDQYVILNKAVTDANTAIDTFNTANTTKIAITALTASVDATAKQDVFYFANKVNAATDISIGGTSVAFGAGDSIVLGSGYTFNSGALSTGNANTLEFFLVKGATGTQVVVESDAFGNSNTVVGTDGTITASPNAAVINLVGVTADHLSVANGVISYV